MIIDRIDRLEIPFRSIEDNDFGAVLVLGAAGRYLCRDVTEGKEWMGRRAMELLNESCRSIRRKGSRCR